MARRSREKRDEYAAQMRFRAEVKRLIRRYGSVGPICPRCQSPFGSYKEGPGVRGCRGCHRKFRPGVPLRWHESRMAWDCSATALPVLSPEQTIERDIRDVYRHDKYPFNRTTREAMRRVGRSYRFSVAV